MKTHRSAAGARFTFRGTVHPGIKDDKRIEVDARERSRLEVFWKQESIDTKIDYDPGSKLYHVALKKKKFIARCNEGDIVDYTLETVDRNTKQGTRRGVKCVDLQVVRLTAAQRAELALNLPQKQRDMADSHAAFPTVGTAEWGETNQRRAELIRKKIRGQLSDSERQEYETLQRLSLAAVDASFPRQGDAQRQDNSEGSGG